MNSNGVLNSNRFVEKLGIQMLLRNVVIYMLLFTHHYPETYKPKFHCRRQSGMNFGYVTVNGVNSNIYIHKILRNYENQLTME